MGLPDNVKVVIAGLVVIGTAIAGEIIAGPVPNMDLTVPAKISDPVADAGRVAGLPDFGISDRSLDPRTIEFTLGGHLVPEKEAFGAIVGQTEIGAWPLLRFPGAVVD